MANVINVDRSVLDINADAIILPVPARVRKRGIEKSLHPSVKEALSKFKTSQDRYTSFAKDEGSFYNGQIEIYRDVNLGNLDLQSEEISADEIIKLLEEESKIIIILPIKTRDDKEVSEAVYMSCLRTVDVLMKDEDFLNQCKNVAIPNFPELQDSIEKVKKLFLERDFNLFICHSSKPSDIISLN